MKTKLVAIALGCLVGSIVWNIANNRELPATQGAVKIIEVTQDYFIIRQELLRLRRCPIRIFWSLQDARGTMHNDELTFPTNGVVGPSIWIQILPIPKGLRPGPMTLGITKQWACNPLQQLHVIEWGTVVQFDTTAPIPSSAPGHIVPHPYPQSSGL